MTLTWMRSLRQLLMAGLIYNLLDWLTRPPSGGDDLDRPAEEQQELDA
jgi:hypothetical protein